MFCTPLFEMGECYSQTQNLITEKALEMMNKIITKSPLANTSEAVYYIQFYGLERMLFLGAYEWGYLLSVECADIDNNGSKERRLNL